MAFGSTYSVTASTQPGGQTCAVTGASGTMPATNVSSVQVSCSNNTFTSAGAYTWTVPAGVTSIQVVAIGAGGGGSPCCSQDVGGNGALVTSTLSVQPGDVLAIYVGGGGQANNEGGGGGGLTYVGDGATNFLIAGGGGGAGGGDVYKRQVPSRSPVAIARYIPAAIAGSIARGDPQTVIRRGAEG